MKSVALRLAVMAVVLLVTSCVPRESEESAVLKRGLELPPAPPGNFYETAWEGHKLGERFVIIPRSAWEAAVAAGDPALMQADNEQRVAAAEAASVANDLWAAGAFSDPVTENDHEFSTTDIVLVAMDPQITSDGRILTSEYFVSGAGISGSSPWVGRNATIAIIPQSTGGGGRCCGAEIIGQQTYPPIEELPGEDCVPTPTALCWGQVNLVPRTEHVGPGYDRVQNGMPIIPMKIFAPTGTEHQIELFPPFGGIGSTSCTYTRQDCTLGAVPGALPSGWEADVPRGGACAPNSPVSGRLVPERCQMASVSMSLETPGGGWGVARPAGGAAPLAECDGRCPGCSDPSAMWNTDVVPRQCWIAQTTGEDDICGLGTASEIAALQATIRDFEVSQTSDFCGDLSDPTARCGSCSVITQPTDALGVAGLQFCSRCSQPLASGGLTNCRRYPNWIGMPIDQVADLHPVQSYEDPRVCENGVCVEPQTPAIKTQACVNPGCGKYAASPVMPSGSPRPGAMQSLDEVHLNAVAAESDDTGGTTPDEPKDTVRAENNATLGDPVSLVDGSFTLHQTDLSFPGPHRALTFTRYYSSQTSTRGPLGSNWVHNWEVRVVPLSKANMPDWMDPYCASSPMETTCVMLVSGESSRFFYLDQATGVFVPQAGSMATVKRHGTGWIVRQPDGHKLFFNHRGYLIADKDRFGSGFRLEWELTDAGRLYEALCGRPAFVIVNGTWVPTTGDGRLSSDGAGCVLLGGLTGNVRMPEVLSTTSTSAALLSYLTPATSDITDPVLIAARQAVVDSQRDNSGNPRFGVPLRSGSHAMRLLRVADDLGRELQFTYGTTGVEKGLLKTVTGPAGASVTFTYQSPVGQSVLPVPEGLNEAFLWRALRTDSATSDPEMVAAGGRGFEFEYAFLRSDQMPNDIQSAATNYGSFFHSIYNCGFHTRDQCGNLSAAGAMFADVNALVAAQRRRLYSEAADNITTVTVKDEAGGVSYVESETRYGSNVYDEHFDKVRAQRWGSVADSSLPAVLNHPTSPAFAWQTALPLATFDYQDAVPRSTAGGTLTGDETDDFLPQALRTRYPLELESGDAVHYSWNKGLLLPAHASAGLPAGAGLPMLAVNAPQTSVSGQLLPGCGLDRLLVKRTRLPGYHPSIDYFDRTLPTVNLGTPGVSWSQQLQRSRLSCDTLSLAQTYDVRHNDLASTWQKALNGDYVFETMTGRRAHTAANANRICSWSKYIDRDGDVHYTGVNFQGRALVDAVRVMNGVQETWKVAETLYNADGNVLAQRRTTSGATAWTESAGDTRYTYLEEPIPSGSLGSIRPYHWAKRGNVIAVVDRPRGGLVWDEVEGQPGTKVQSSGRYTVYGYEPFFNQVNFVESGNLTTSGAQEPTSRTRVVMDYQEYANESAAPFVVMLDELQSWGAVLRRQNGIYDWSFIRANQLFVDFAAADVNGDGVQGGQKGVPVFIENLGGNLLQNPSRESTYLSWSSAGSLASVLSPDKVLTEFSYYRLDQPGRGQTDLPATGEVSPGNSGFLASITRTRKGWPSSAGPARSSCASLPPQYRFLLTSCGSDLAASLAALGLSPEAVSGVLSAGAGSTTRFSYNAAGYVSAARGQSGTLTKSITDTDGRVRRADLFGYGSSSSHSYVQTEFDRYMRPYRVRRFAGNGTSLGATLRTFDNDNRVLTECHELQTGGCDPGGSPLARTSQRWIYTREGDLYRHIDPEGLVAERRRDGRKWVTLEKLISPAPGEGERLAVTSYDDDGNVQTRTYGSGNAVLNESMTWDGFGRRIGHADTQGRQWEYGYSKRGVMISTTHGSTSAPWNEVYTWDGFGRLYSVEENGVVTAEYWRLPGGLPFATSATGRAPSFVTFDELGRVVFAEDAAGNQSVSTEVGASSTAVHRVTQSTIRKRASGPLTTGTIATLDELGLASELREVGGGLSRTTTVLERTGSGFLKRVRAPDGAETEADYDFLGRVTALRQQQAFGVTGFDASTYTYNARGQLDTVVDPAGNATVHRYTGFGEPQFKSKPASRPVESYWVYDALGRKVQYQAAGGAVDLGYRYEASTGRLEAIVRGDPKKAQSPVLQEFDYDELGRWTEATHHNLGLGSAFGFTAADRDVKSTRTYDDAQRRYTETTQVGRQAARTVVADWDVTVNNSWLRTVTLPDGRTVAEGHDADGRQVELQRANGGVTDFTWVDELLAETSSTKTGAPLKRMVGFDGLAQPVSWNFTHQASGPAALSVDVRRDVMGRIGSSSLTFTTPASSVASWRGYAYDAMGRLSVLREGGVIPANLPATHQLPQAMESAIEAAGNSVSAQRWAYTREVVVGSVLSISRTDVTTTPPRFSTPALYQTPFGHPTARLEGHQLERYEVGNSGTRTVAHDDAGRVTSDGTQDFVFDDFGTLVAVKEAGGGAEKEVYLFDVTGRLVGVRGPDGAGEVLTYDGAQAVQARTWAGAVAWTAAWGPGVDHLVSVEKEGHEYFALDDGKGSVVGWLDGASNAVVGRAEYTPEGRGRYADEVAGTTCDETDEVRCPRPLDMPFGFHTAYASRTTGLLYFRNRWYSPEANQWLSQDPLDAVDSFNLYAFNGFDSVNFVDPWGLDNTEAVNQGCNEEEWVCYSPTIVVTPEPEPEPEPERSLPCVACRDRSEAGPTGSRAQREARQGSPSLHRWVREFVQWLPPVRALKEHWQNESLAYEIRRTKGPKTKEEMLDYLKNRDSPRWAEYRWAEDFLVFQYMGITGGLKVVGPRPSAPAPAPKSGSSSPKAAQTAPTGPNPAPADPKRGGANPATQAAASAPSSQSNTSKATSPYKRPSGATTTEQRAAVQNKPCATCGAREPKNYADHKTPLVQEHYETGAIDKERMRSLDAVQPQCPTCSNKQGGTMSGYSKAQKKALEAGQGE